MERFAQIPGLADRRFVLRSGKTLGFLHIPKCAGTSIMNSIALQGGKGQHISGFDRCLFGDFQRFDRIPKSIRKLIHLETSALPTDASTVMGHFAFNTLRGRYPDADLAIFLREPSVRLLSHWVYWRSLTWNSLRYWGAEWSARLKLARLPLHGFLSHPQAACQTDNIATRMLVWPHSMIPPDQFIDPANDAALLKLAVENLECFDFAGITERGPAVYREFSKWLGIGLDLPTLNPALRMRRSERTRLGDEMTPATLALLQARTRLDARLWQLLAVRKMSDFDAQALQKRAVVEAIARFSVLLA